MARTTTSKRASSAPQPAKRTPKKVAKTKVVKKATVTKKQSTKGAKTKPAPAVSKTLNDNLSADSILRIAGNLVRRIQAEARDSESLLLALESQAESLTSIEEQAALSAFQSLKDRSGTKKVTSDNKTDRGYFDGCFDLCHSGHFNALRQASKTVHTLLVGPNSDAEVLRYKGPTIMNENERAQIVRAVKWGDIVVPNTPYEASQDFLDSINCQYFVHGDDPVMCDGVNVNEQLTAVGRFKEIRRTTGISTTDLTGKLLHLLDHETESQATAMSRKRFENPPKQTFLQTSARIANFSNRREPNANENIVYFQASCDLMHPGVIERLKAAKAQGDFLYVGLWDDEMIKYYRGEKYPLQGMQERLLMALAMKYVDDVVIGAPYIITDDLLKSLNIKKVVHVLTREDKVKPEYQGIDPYEVAKAKGIYVELPAVNNDMTLEDIAQRVQDNKTSFQNKFNARKAKQDDYYVNLKKSKKNAMGGN